MAIKAATKEVSIPAINIQTDTVNTWASRVRLLEIAEEGN